MEEAVLSGCPNLRLALGKEWVLVESPYNNEGWRFRAAMFRSPDWHLADLSSLHLRGQAGPPRGFAIGALVGWLLAFSALFVSWRVSSPARRLMLYGFVLSITGLTQMPLIQENMLRIL
jgi:hypothetical protein